MTVQSENVEVLLLHPTCQRCASRKPSIVIRRAGVVVEVVCSSCMERELRPAQHRSFTIGRPASPKFEHTSPADLRAIVDAREQERRDR
jgi:hypothetical protein